MQLKSPKCCHRFLAHSDTTGRLGLHDWRLGNLGLYICRSIDKNSAWRQLQLPQITSDTVFERFTYLQFTIYN